ncbi:hypothetical protein KQX54_020622 [Cotesia glomerata]|uniref:Uncharacterized protein n=1 Tax=Cotesia glomerata TaxID=32391 RepID=A0AAV7I1N4_COTGL|nr:hypothetical protein KQX54_020622 [Cotesia glomerata]
MLHCPSVLVANVPRRTDTKFRDPLVFVNIRLTTGTNRPGWYALSNFGIGGRILGMVGDFLHIKAFGLEGFELFFWERSLKFEVSLILHLEFLYPIIVSRLVPHISRLFTELSSDRQEEQNRARFFPILSDVFRINANHTGKLKLFTVLCSPYVFHADRMPFASKIQLSLALAVYQLCVTSVVHLASRAWISHKTQGSRHKLGECARQMRMRGGYYGQHPYGCTLICTWVRTENREPTTGHMYPFLQHPT